MIKKEIYIKMYITLLLLSIAILLVATNIFGLGVAFDISIPTKNGKIGIVTLPALVGLLLLTSVLMGYILILRSACKVTDIKATLTSVTNAYDYLSIFIWAIVAVYLIFILVAFPVTVTQNSMTPTVLDGEKLIVSANPHNLKREDVVVFKIDSSKLNVSSEYDDELWSYLIEKAVVNCDGSIKFVFKNGKEIIE